MKLSWNSLFVLCLLGTFSALAVDVLDGKQLSYNTSGVRKSIYVPKVPGKAFSMYSSNNPVIVMK